MELNLHNRTGRDASAGFDQRDGALARSLVMRNSDFMSITELLIHLHGLSDPQGHVVPRSRMGRLKATRSHKARTLIPSHKAREVIDHHVSNEDHILNTLIRRGVTSEDDIVLEFTTHHGFPYIPLNNYDVSHEALRIVSRSAALRHLVVPMDVMGNNLMIAMANPLDIHAIREVEAQSGCFVQVFVSTMSDIKRALSRCYPDPLEDLSGEMKEPILS